MESNPSSPENPIPPTTTPPPPVTPVSSHKKPFVLIGAILLVVIAITATIIFSLYSKPNIKPLPTPTISPSPTSDETANWKTYTNTKYNYEIKYPSDLEIVKGPVPDLDLPKLDNISFSGKQKPNDPNSGVGFAINVNPTNPSGNPISCPNNENCLSEWMKILGKTPDQVSYVNANMLNSNQKGFEYTTQNSLYTQLGRYFAFPYNNYVLIVSLTINNYSDTEIQGINTLFDQILSTFKFLDDQTDTANWKTYVSPKYNLHLQYPMDWHITQKLIVMGQSLKEVGRYDIHAFNSDTEVVDVTSQDWMIRIVIRQAVDVNQLGGFGPIDSLSGYKKYQVLGRTALRTKIEEGFMPAIADHPEPYPFPILFQRLPGEESQAWRTPDQEGSYVQLFSINDSQNKYNIEIALYSNQLTKENIENHNFNTEELNTIDQILSTFQFTN